MRVTCGEWLTFLPRLGQTPRHEEFYGHLHPVRPLFRCSAATNHIICVNPLEYWPGSTERNCWQVATHPSSLYTHECADLNPDCGRPRNAAKEETPGPARPPPLDGISAPGFFMLKSHDSFGHNK